MTSIYKVTKSKAINFILLTVSALFVFSCGRHAPVSRSHTDNHASKKHNPEEVKVSHLISVAHSYLGTNYKYGGSTRQGMDCSGLMLSCFKAVDIMLPRVSKEQSLVGKAVKFNELREGDMVFFTDKKGSSKITHVGLITKVLDAHNITFIHASTKQGVVEENIFASYYLPFFVKAVRVL
jgi:probable lipoprotein NlpC